MLWCCRVIAAGQIGKEFVRQLFLDPRDDGLRLLADSSLARSVLHSGMTCCVFGFVCTAKISPPIYFLKKALQPLAEVCLVLAPGLSVTLR